VPYRGEPSSGTGKRVLHREILRADALEGHVLMVEAMSGGE
jgi:hypothetical protein